MSIAPTRSATCRAKRVLASSIALALGVFALQTHAGIITWDQLAAGSNNSAIDAGSGTWDTATANWTSTAGATNILWTAGNDAVFSGADGAVDAYAITLGATGLNPNTLTFNSTGYILQAASANTLALQTGGTTATQFTVTSGKTVTIGSNVSVQRSDSVTNNVLGITGGGTINVGKSDGTSTGAALIMHSTNTNGNNLQIFGGTTINLYAGGTMGTDNGGGIVIGTNTGNNATVNVLGGTLSTVRVGNSGSMVLGSTSGGTGTLNVTNGFVTVDAAALTSTSIDGSTTGGLRLSGAAGATGIVNLDGGTITAPRIYDGGGTSTFNFNGGTLRANKTTTIMMRNLNTANVRNGGAIIDSNSFNISIDQALLHSGIGGDNATDGGLTKNGTGTLTLNGANTYNGGTTLNAGVLSLGSAGAIGSTGTITFAGGNLQFGANNTTDYSARFSSALGQAYSLDTNGQTVLLATPLTSSNGSLTKSGTGILGMQTGSTFSGSTAVTAGTLRLLGTSLPSVNSNVNVSGTALVEITGNTSLAVGTAANQIQLTGTTVGFGAVGTPSTLNIGSVAWATGGFAPSTALQLGTTTSDSKITLAGTIDLNGASRTVSVIHGTAVDADAEISAPITATGGFGLTKTGTGYLVLSGANTFDGKITISAGKLEVSSINKVSGGAASSNLGAPTTSANGTLAIGNGNSNDATLRYVGPGETTDRLVTLNGGGSKVSTIDASGSDALLFSNTASVGFGGTGTGATSTLNLAGTSTATNTFAFQIIDPNNGSGGVNLLKSGTGTWMLTNLNSNFKFATTISAGTLIAGNDVINTLTPDGSAVRRGEQNISSINLVTGDFSYAAGSGYEKLALGDRVVMGAGAAPTGTSNNNSYYIVSQDTVNHTFQIASTPGGTAIVPSSAGTSVGFYQSGALGSASSAVRLGDANTAATSAPAFLLGNAAAGYTTNRQILVATTGSSAATYTIGGNSDAINTFAGLVTANKDLTVSQVATTGSNALAITGGITGSTVLDSGTQTVKFAGPGAINLTTNPISNGTGGGTTNTAVAVTGGTISLNVDSTYSGGTTVTGGKLLVNNGFAGGSATGSGAVNVTGGTLGGNGIINGPVTIGVSGNLAPGQSPGTLTIDDDLTLAGTTTMELGASSHDHVDVNTISNLLGEILTFGGDLNVSNYLAGPTYAAGQVYDLFDWGSNTTVAGTFAQVSLPSLPVGLQWRDFGGSNFDYATGSIEVESAVIVPEPASLGILALGAAGLLLRRRK